MAAVLLCMKRSRHCKREYPQKSKMRIILFLALACLVIIDSKVVAFTPPSKICTKIPPNHHATHIYSSISYESQIQRYIDIDETASRDISSFEQWCYNYEIQRNEGLQLAYNNDGTDIHTVTSTDLPAGTCALYVPEALILSASKAMAELQGPDMQAAEKIVYSVNAESELQRYYLMVKILVEYEKGEESPWFYWLNS